MAVQSALTKRIYGAFRKVEENDDGTLTVAGVASSGNMDEAGETILPEAMKAALPDYMRFANIREMHDAKAAGVAVTADVDADGFTNIETVIVDPVAITKVKTGVYKGFSIGGKVLARDPNNRTVITKIRLSEISLVDRPCNPDALFSLVKIADGETEGTDMAYAPTNDEVKAAAEEMAKAAGKTGKANDFILKAREKLIADHETAEAEGRAAAEADLAEKRAKVEAEVRKQSPEISDEDLTKVADAATFTGDQPFDEQLEASVQAALAKVAAETETPAADAAPEGADTITGADSGTGGADTQETPAGESADKVDLADALTAAVEKAASITAEPASDPAQVTPGLVDFGKGLAKLATVVEADPLAKGMWTVSALARLIDELSCIQASTAWEAKNEGDASPIPQELATSVQALGASLVNMAKEEVAELLAEMNERGGDVEIVIVGDDFEYASAVVDLVKADTDLMEKAGARHSKKDMAAIQAMHDTAAGLGAKCASAEKAAGEDDDLTKALAEKTRLEESVAKALPAIETLTKGLEEARAEIELLKAQPAASRAAGSVHAVRKGEDAAGGGEPAELTPEQVSAELAKMPEHERNLLLTKAALRLPISA